MCHLHQPTPPPRDIPRSTTSFQSRSQTASDDKDESWDNYFSANAHDGCNPLDSAVLRRPSIILRLHLPRSFIDMSRVNKYQDLYDVETEYL